MTRVHSGLLIEALRAAGLVPEDARRVIIDLQIDHVPVVHIERYGGDELLQVVEAAIRSADVVSAPNTRE